MQSTPLTPEFLAAQDCVLISTDHSAFDYPFIARHSRLIVDTRNATRNVSSQDQHKIFRA
jgi:UDP-N-acetyl-D-glucosamine dehydrogenase